MRKLRFRSTRELSGTPTRTVGNPNITERENPRKLLNSHIGPPRALSCLPKVSLGEEVITYGWGELDYVAEHHEFCLGNGHADRAAARVLLGRLGPAGTQSWATGTGRPEPHRCGPESAAAWIAQPDGSRTRAHHGGWRGEDRNSNETREEERVGATYGLPISSRRSSAILARGARAEADSGWSGSERGRPLRFAAIFRV